MGWWVCWFGYCPFTCWSTDVKTLALYCKVINIVQTKWIICFPKLINFSTPTHITTIQILLITVMQPSLYSSNIASVKTYLLHCSLVVPYSTACRVTRVNFKRLLGQCARLGDS